MSAHLDTFNLQFALSHSLAVSCDTACGNWWQLCQVASGNCGRVGKRWRLSLDTASVIQRTKLWLQSPFPN